LGPCAKAQVKYSTLYSIIPFLERKKDIPLTPQGRRVFLWSFNQTTLEKTRVSIDLKGEKS
jgi:hypothetical protein